MEHWEESQANTTPVTQLSRKHGHMHGVEEVVGGTEGTFYLVPGSRLHQRIIWSWVALNLKSTGRPVSGASYLPEVLHWYLVLQWCPQSYPFARIINAHEILKVQRQGHLHRSYCCGGLLHSQHTREPSHGQNVSHFTGYRLGSLRRVGNPVQDTTCEAERGQQSIPCSREGKEKVKTTKKDIRHGSNTGSAPA